MASTVLDSSAVLALLQQEPGAERVAAYVAGAVVSAVNLHEVVARMADLGVPDEAVEAILEPLRLTVHPHDAQAALAAGRLRRATRRAGLSLGDRACLALARGLDVPAVTADRAWTAVADDIGVRVEVIR